MIDEPLDLENEPVPLYIPPFIRRWGGYFLLVLAVLAAWSNVYDNAFLYDDESLILKNAFLTGSGHLVQIFTTSITAGSNVPGGFYRPLQIFAYFLTYQLCGPSTVAYHLLNVGLHAANACLVYALGRRLRFKPIGSFFAALIWALHPVQVEAVTYVSGTADPLFVFFTLTGLILLLPRFRPKQIAFASAFFLLALLAKEEAIIFPVLASSCLFLLDRRRFKPGLYVKLWPLWLMAVLYYLVHDRFLNFNHFELYHQHDVYADSIRCRIYTALATVPLYLKFLLWPVHLHYDRDFQPVTNPFAFPVLLGFVIMMAPLFIILRSRRKRMLAVSWGCIWAIAAHLLHSGILRPVNAMVLEHWLYLPTAGLFLGIAEAAARGWDPSEERKNRFMKWALGIVIFCLTVITYQQNTVWADPMSFYLNIFKNGEPSPHAHNNLGVEYSRRGDYQKAIEQFDLAIQWSGDTNPQAHHDLAITYLNGPEAKEYRQEAIQNLKRALELSPDYYPSALALQEIYRQNGDKKNEAFYKAKAEAAHTELTGEAPLADPKP